MDDPSQPAAGRRKQKKPAERRPSYTLIPVYFERSKSGRRGLALAPHGAPVICFPRLRAPARPGPRAPRHAAKWQYTAVSGTVAAGGAGIRAAVGRAKQHQLAACSPFRGAAECVRTTRAPLHATSSAERAATVRPVRV